MLREGCSLVGLVPYKVYITDPELTAPGGLYVYLWVCGVDIKGDFIL